MKPMSKAFYLGSFIGAMALLILLSAFIVSLIYVVADNSKTEDYAVLGLVMLGIFSLVIGIYLLVVTAVMIYRIWNAIEDKDTPIFPVLSIVLFLVPLVNFFWFLIVFPLYVKYYNKYVKRWEVGVKELDPGIFYTFPLFVVTYIVGIGVNEIFRFMPESSLQETIYLSFGLLGIFGFVASLVVFLVIVSRLCDAVNILPRTMAGNGMVRSAGI